MLDRVSIHECKDCSFAWQFPVGRTADASKSFFQMAYKASGKVISPYFDPAWRKAIARLQVEYLNRFVRPSRLIDIGAGAGFFAVEAASTGWEVVAVDPAIDPQTVRAEGVTALAGGTEEIRSGEFDLVTIWDVIEHVEQPYKLLTEAHRLLKKNGLLVIETGNYKSVERILGGCEHWIYQLDHRWYFSPDSLIYLLQQAGFDEIEVCSSVLRPNWTGSESYLGPSRFQLLRDLIRRPHQLLRRLKMHASMVTASRWQHSGLNIFTLAARRKG